MRSPVNVLGVFRLVRDPILPRNVVVIKLSHWLNNFQRGLFRGFPLIAGLGRLGLYGLGACGFSLPFPVQLVLDMYRHSGDSTHKVRVARGWRIYGLN